MSISGASLVSFNFDCAWGSTVISGMAAVAVGVATLAIGVVPAAADPADDEAETPAVADAGSRETERPDADAEEADRETAAAGKTESAAKTGAGREIESEVVVVEPAEVCRRVRDTGSRVPKVVCTPVTRTEADRTAARAQEQRTEDYLRRRDSQSNRVPEDNGFIGGSALGGLQ